MKRLKQNLRKASLIIASGLVLISCSNSEEQSTKDMIMNMDKQNEVMDMIVNDPDMMNNMMNHITESDNAMMMMSGNIGMMRHMMGSDSLEPMMMRDHDMMSGMMGHMMSMMASDSIVCNDMENMMMGNEHMMGVIMDMSGRRNNGMMKGDETPRHMHGMMH